MSRHPSLRPMVPVQELTELTGLWKSYARSATKAGRTDIADIWLSAADDVKDLSSKARQRSAMLAERMNRSVVEHRAAARQLKTEAHDLYRKSAGYLEDVENLTDRNGHQAKQAFHAADEAHRKAERLMKALDILCEHTGLDPDDL